MKACVASFRNDLENIVKMTPNKRMQSDRSTRYASESAADAACHVLREKP